MVCARDREDNELHRGDYYGDKQWMRSDQENCTWENGELGTEKLYSSKFLRINSQNHLIRELQGYKRPQKTSNNFQLQ